jgi:ribosomal protein S18 acetylase RimI-like enzyme
MAIRFATLADAPLIAQVHVASYKAAYRGQLPSAGLDKIDVQDRTLRWQEILADRSSSTLAYESHGQVVGFVHYGPSRDSDAEPQRVGEIASIYVNPSSWGTGVGQALIQEAIQRLIASGFEEISLWVLATNERARRSYERAGFVLDGAVKEDTKLGTPVKIVRYRKNLRELG